MFGMGRPPIVLDDLRAKRLVEAVRSGLSRRGVAGRTGISKSLLQEWLARGLAGEQPYADLLDRVKEAEAEVEQRRIAVVQQAADDGTWQAAAWMLERTMPEEYALRKPTEQEVATPTEEESRKRWRELTGRDFEQAEVCK